MALPGRGKRGSTRTLVGTNKGDRWFFLYGFEKNERDNIDEAELRALRTYARDLLGQALKQLNATLAAGDFQEICHDQEPNS